VCADLGTAGDRNGTGTTLNDLGLFVAALVMLGAEKKAEKQHTLQYCTIIKSEASKGEGKIFTLGCDEEGEEDNEGGARMIVKAHKVRASGLTCGRAWLISKATRNSASPGMARGTRRGGLLHEVESSCCAGGGP